MSSSRIQRAAVAVRFIVLSIAGLASIGCGPHGSAPANAPQSSKQTEAESQTDSVSPDSSPAQKDDAASMEITTTAGTPAEGSPAQSTPAEPAPAADRRSDKTPDGPVLAASKPPDDAAPPADDADDVGQRRPLHDWPKPDAVIIFSGQQHGYTEPCGCDPLHQKGGLARRAGFIDTLRQKGWPLLALDLGGLLEDDSEPFGEDKFFISQEQRMAKLETSLDAMHRMGCTIMNLGPEDLSVPDGLVGLASVLSNTGGDTDAPVALNANLGIEDAFIDLGVFKPYVVREVGPFRIAVTGMVGDKHKERLQDPTLRNKRSPDEALPDIIDEMKQESDFQVLLLYDELDEAKRLAKKFPDLDLIIHAYRFDEPPGRTERADDDSKTLLVTAGTKGKHVGAVGIYRDADEQMRFELVPLDRRLPEDKAVRELLDVEYLRKLETAKLVERSPKRPFDPAHPKLSFVGSDQCKQCHPNVYQHWKKTNHASALETLVTGHAKNKPAHQSGGKQVNPECVVCHTTGFRYLTGYDGTEKSKHLGGNGCENCHGAASEHVESYSDPNAPAELLTRARKIVHLEPQIDNRNVCSRCHDLENDSTFVFDKRWFQPADGMEPVEHGDPASEDRKLWKDIREKLAKKQ